MSIILATDAKNAELVTTLKYQSNILTKKTKTWFTYTMKTDVELCEIGYAKQ